MRHYLLQDPAAGFHAVEADGSRLETAFWHEVSGRRYTSIRDEPRHATLDGYKQCVREAYGSLSGIRFGSFQRERF